MTPIEQIDTEIKAASARILEQYAGVQESLRADGERLAEQARRVSLDAVLGVVTVDQARAALTDLTLASASRLISHGYRERAAAIEEGRETLLAILKIAAALAVA